MLLRNPQVAHLLPYDCPMTRRSPGSGTIRERGKGVYQLRVYVGADPLTGRPRQRTRTVRVRTKSEANKALASFVAETARDRPAPEDRTVGWVLEQWSRQQEVRGWAPTTAHVTRGRLSRVTVPRLGHVKLGELTAEHVDLFYNALQSGEATGQPMQPATVRRYLADLSAALNLAVAWGLIDRNPVKGARLPKRARAVVKMPSPEDCRRLLAAAGAFGPRWGVLVALLLATGARRSEVCALRWTDVEGPVIRLSRALYRAGAVRGEKGLKTGGERVVTVGPVMAAMLERWRATCEQAAASAGVRLVPDAFVVPASPDGARPVNPDDLSRTVRFVCDELGLPHVHVHSLRHFAVTEMLAGGVTVRTASERVGHASAKMTLDLYAHSSDERQLAAALVLDNVLMPAESPPGATAPPAS